MTPQTQPTDPRWAIQAAIVDFFTAVDQGEWDRAASMMTAPFHADYQSFGGGPPADVKPKDLVAGWAAFLPGFEHTHHQLGNIKILPEGERAKAEAYITATHTIGDRVWTVVGSYEFALKRIDANWKLSSLRLLFKYQAGDLGLPKEAGARAKAK